MWLWIKMDNTMPEWRMPKYMQTPLLGFSCIATYLFWYLGTDYVDGCRWWVLIVLDFHRYLGRCLNLTPTFQPLQLGGFQAPPWIMTDTKNTSCRFPKVGERMQISVVSVLQPEKNFWGALSCHSTPGKDWTFVPKKPGKTGSCCSLRRGVWTAFDPKDSSISGVLC